MNKYQRILFIGPDDRSLKVIPELDALYELGFEVRTLQSNVSDDRLFDAVRNQRYDIVHFAAHGDLTSTTLSNSILSYQGIQQIVRQCGAKLVFLNECKSASIAQRLVNSGQPVAIGTFSDVDDIIAKQVAISFYNELQRTQDPHVAYAFACTGENYGYFSNGAYTELILEPMAQQIERLRYDLRYTRAWTYGLIIVLFIISLITNMIQHWGLHFQ